MEKKHLLALVQKHLNDEQFNAAYTPFVKFRQLYAFARAYKIGEKVTAAEKEFLSEWGKIFKERDQELSLVLIQIASE